MLFQHKPAFLIALASLVISGTSIGGTVNSQPLSTETQEYRYPPANALASPKPKTMPAPAIRQPSYAGPQRMAPRYPQPYAGQRPINPGIAPYGAPRPAPVPYGTPMNRPPVVPPVAGPGPARPVAGPQPTGPVAGPRPMRPGPGVPPPYGNPYNRGPYGGGPYGGGPFGGNNFFDNFGFGPFNRNTAPWETWPFGSRDSFWSRKEFPFDNQNPSDWFNPGDPKEGLAIMWEDLISAPDDLGTMPGGWHVPSISVPNPVDLEDQMEEASKEVPDLIRIYTD